MEAVLEQTATRIQRPKILDEIMGEIDEGSRKEELVKQKRQIETNLMSALANIRVQESILQQKEDALDQASEEMSEYEEQGRIRSIDQARLELEDRYQGGVALAEELRRVNEALKDMASAGLAPFGNREARRRKRN